jgi:hypothetical protein
VVMVVLVCYCEDERGACDLLSLCARMDIAKGRERGKASFSALVPCAVADSFIYLLPHPSIHPSIHSPPRHMYIHGIRLVAVAKECGARGVVSVLEGGYDLRYMLVYI